MTTPGSERGKAAFIAKRNTRGRPKIGIDRITVSMGIGQRQLVRRMAAADKCSDSEWLRRVIRKEWALRDPETGQVVPVDAPPDVEKHVEPIRRRVAQVEGALALLRDMIKELIQPWDRRD